MQLVLMMVGRSLLAGLLLTGGLNLWRRLNRCCRNLRLMETGRRRIERNRQHLLEAHPRDTPRYIPGTRMMLHLRYELLRTSSHKRPSLNNSNNKKYASSSYSHSVSLSIMNRTRETLANSTGSINTLCSSSHVVAPGTERKQTARETAQEKKKRSPTRASQEKV